MPVSDPLLDPAYARADLGAPRRAHADAGDARGAARRAARANAGAGARGGDGCGWEAAAPARVGVAGGCAVLALGLLVARMPSPTTSDGDFSASPGASSVAAAAGAATAAAPADSTAAAEAAPTSEGELTCSPGAGGATDVRHRRRRGTAPAPDGEADDRPEVVERRLRCDRRGDPRDRHLRRPHRHRPVRDAGGFDGAVGDRREGADRAHAGGHRTGSPRWAAWPARRSTSATCRSAPTRSSSGSPARAPADRAVRRPAGGDRPDEAPEGDAGRAPRPCPPAPGRPERRRLGDDEGGRAGRPDGDPGDRRRPGRPGRSPAPMRSGRARDALHLLADVGVVVLYARSWRPRSCWCSA